jgi:GNAT superfamily N-acetyltransferase
VSDEASIVIRDSLGGVTGATLKQFYAAAEFDNGRTAEEYERSFRNSVVRLAFDGDRVIGAARAITDGVYTAAVFDVCVLPGYRKRGLGRRIVQSLLDGLKGQFVVLVCDEELRKFYGAAGLGPLRPHDVAMARGDSIPRDGGHGG